jgi:hypothetical protein
MRVFTTHKHKHTYTNVYVCVCALCISATIFGLSSSHSMCAYTHTHVYAHLLLSKHLLPLLLALPSLPQIQFEPLFHQARLLLLESLILFLASFQLLHL